MTAGREDLAFLRRRTPPPRPSAPTATPPPVRAAAPAAPVREARAHPEHDGPAPDRPDLGFLRRRTPAPRPSAPRPPAAAPPAAAPPAAAPPRSPARPASAPRVDVDPVPVREQPASPSGAPALQGFSTLRADAPTVTVPPPQSTTGALRLHLMWSTLPTDERSVRAGLKRSTDVHLGVLWEMTDGAAGVVQSLGDSPAAPGHGSTVLRLGPRSEVEGESVTVALQHVHALKRLVVFAYGIGMHPEWDALAPQLVLELKGGVEVQLGLDHPAPPGATIAVLASVHRVAGDLVVRREGAYLVGQQAAVAEEYGWELPWASGRTVPRRGR